MCQAAAVEVQHADAAAHCQEVGAAVQRRQVDEDGPEATLHLQENTAKAWWVRYAAICRRTTKKGPELA